MTSGGVHGQYPMGQVGRVDADQIPDHLLFRSGARLDAVDQQGPTVSRPLQGPALRALKARLIGQHVPQGAGGAGVQVHHHQIHAPALAAAPRGLERGEPAAVGGYLGVEPVPVPGRQAVKQPLTRVARPVQGEPLPAAHPEGVAGQVPAQVAVDGFHRPPAVSLPVAGAQVDHVGDAHGGMAAGQGHNPAYGQQVATVGRDGARLQVVLVVVEQPGLASCQRDGVHLLLGQAGFEGEAQVGLPDLQARPVLAVAEADGVGTGLARRQGVHGDRRRPVREPAGLLVDGARGIVAAGVAQGEGKAVAVDGLVELHLHRDRQGGDPGVDRRGDAGVLLEVRPYLHRAGGAAGCQGAPLNFARLAPLPESGGRRGSLCGADRGIPRPDRIWRRCGRRRGAAAHHEKQEAQPGSDGCRRTHGGITSLPLGRVAGAQGCTGRRPDFRREALSYCDNRT